MLFLLLFLLCFRACLFIDALWLPASKELTSWLLSVMSHWRVNTFPLVSWVRYSAWLYRFLIFALFLTFIHIFMQILTSLFNRPLKQQICYSFTLLISYMVYIDLIWWSSSFRLRQIFPILMVPMLFHKFNRPLAPFSERLEIPVICIIVHAKSYYASLWFNMAINCLFNGDVNSISWTWHVCHWHTEPILFK